MGSDFAEIDFRWVKDAREAKRVERYELAREIFLLADQKLKDEPTARGRLRKAVADGSPFTGFSELSSPLAAYYSDLQTVAGARNMRAFDLPSALSLRKNLKKLWNVRDDVSAISIGPVSESYDMRWMHCQPDVILELSLSRHAQFGLAQAVKEFEQWARKSGYFDASNPGGRPQATLLHLAYFRFSKGKSPTEPRRTFGDHIRSSTVCSGSSAITPYGAALYAAAARKDAVSAATWSEAVARTGLVVIPIVQLLVSRFSDAPAVSPRKTSKR